MFPDADITTDIADFFSGEAYYYATEQQQPVSFRGGTAYVQRSKPPNMEVFEPDLDHVVHEVEVEGVKLPKVEAVEKTVHGPTNQGNSILTGKGAFRSVGPHRSSFGAKDFLEISMPDGWGLLKAFFEHYGYECTPSDKSPALLSQISLLGGVEGINVLANSRVFETLKKMSIRKGGSQAEKERLYLADREVKSYNFFTNTNIFGHERAKVILRWLVENRLVLRGVKLTCRQCSLKLWYAIDRIGEQWMCDGCRQEMPIPVRLDSADWKYRINELWANSGHQQGSIAALLAIYAMHAKWGSSFIREGFGYYPGVRLKKRDNASVPGDDVEIDLVALWGSRPVLVECKGSSKDFEDPKEANEFAGQLAKQVKLAEHIDAHKVIIASPSQFPKDKSILTSKVPKGNTVRIEWWDKDDLLDPIYLVNGVRANNSETLHLEWLGNWLTELYSEH